MNAPATKAMVMEWWPRGPIERRRAALALIEQRDELLAACAALLAGGWHKTHCPAFPPGGDEADCDCGWAAAVESAEMAIAMARGTTVATEVVRVPSENLGDLTGTKFGERLAKYAAKKARGK